jgi:hypothetical protein
VTEVPQADMRNIVTTLLKIITNITQNPMEPKFRKLPKHSKSMQEKILRYPYAIHFLVAAGFADDGENWSLNGFDKDKLLQAEKAIEDFVRSLGANVVTSTFDPFKASVSSYSGVSQV